MTSPEVRSRSVLLAQELGYPTNPSLPLLSDERPQRPKAEVVNRLLALLAVVASSYGFPNDDALAWLEQEGLGNAITPVERAFLQKGAGERIQFQAQVEALFALSWALKISTDLDFSRPCPKDLVGSLPDLNENEASDAFRSRTSLRSQEELAAGHDLAYCLHWAIRHAQLEKLPIPGKVPSHVVVERRKALEWLRGSTPWDEVHLDT